MKFNDDDDVCSPAYAGQSHSCFTKDALLMIVRAYNKKHIDPIKVGGGDSKKDIWEAIQYKMQEKCGDDETCWLEQPFLKSNPSLARYFKPLAPLGRYQWLSTDDIYDVMNQYAEKYPDFKFVGALPMDFLKLSDNDSKYLRNIDLTKESQKYKNIGVIFNMDPSTEKGSHWVSMIIKPRSREFHYFDSYGDKMTYPNKYNLVYYDSYGRIHKNQQSIGIPPNVQTLIHRLANNSTPVKKNGSNQKIKLPFRVKINTIQHQFANSECGVYSIMFLVNSLTKSFEKITQNIVADEEANKMREVFFRRK